MYAVLSDQSSPLDEAIADLRSSNTPITDFMLMNDKVNELIHNPYQVRFDVKAGAFLPLNQSSNINVSSMQTPFPKIGEIVALPGFPSIDAENKWKNGNKPSKKPSETLSTKLPIIHQNKITNLRSNSETILVSPYTIDLFGRNKISYIALIRINNNYKLVSCKSIEEFNLIKKLHEIVYGQGIHFNLEYQLIKDANIGYLTDELDNYGFLKNEDIQEELSLIGENLKKLCDVKSFLGYKVSNTNSNVINVLPSFQSQLSSCNNNEILGYDTSTRFGESYATIEPGFEMARTIDIWYNNMFMTGFTLEWEIFLKECNITAEQIKQLGYFKEITKYKNTEINGIVIQELRELFNNQLFKDMNEFQEKVDSILTRQNKQCPNLAKIKQYIIANYDLDDNVEHRIQFSNILNEVIKGLNVAPEFYEMMKKSLPLVLAELNLNKKRYSSGFFWYGLVRKNESSGGNINTIIEDEKEGKIRTEHKYNELIKERGYDT